MEFKYNGIIIFQIPEDASASYILKLIEGFLQEKELLLQLSGKLAIVEPGRIRIRGDF